MNGSSSSNHQQSSRQPPQQQQAQNHNNNTTDNNNNHHPLQHQQIHINNASVIHINNCSVTYDNSLGSLQAANATLRNDNNNHLQLINTLQQNLAAVTRERDQLLNSAKDLQQAHRHLEMEREKLNRQHQDALRDQAQCGQQTVNSSTNSNTNNNSTSNDQNINMNPQVASLNFARNGNNNEIDFGGVGSTQNNNIVVSSQQQTVVDTNNNNNDNDMNVSSSDVEQQQQQQQQPSIDAARHTQRRRPREDDDDDKENDGRFEDNDEHHRNPTRHPQARPTGGNGDGATPDENHHAKKQTEKHDDKSKINKPNNKPRNNANNNKPSSDKILDDAFFHSNKANEICFAVANTNDEIEKVRDFYRGIFDKLEGLERFVPSTTDRERSKKFGNFSWFIKHVGTKEICCAATVNIKPVNGNHNDVDGAFLFEIPLFATTNCCRRGGLARLLNAAIRELAIWMGAEVILISSTEKAKKTFWGHKKMLDGPYEELDDALAEKVNDKHPDCLKKKFDNTKTLFWRTPSTKLNDLVTDWKTFVKTSKFQLVLEGGDNGVVDHNAPPLPLINKECYSSKYRAPASPSMLQNSTPVQSRRTSILPLIASSASRAGSSGQMNSANSVTRKKPNLKQKEVQRKKKPQHNGSLAPQNSTKKVGQTKKKNAQKKKAKKGVGQKKRAR